MATFLIPMVSCELSLWKIYLVNSRIISFGIMFPYFSATKATNSAM